MNRREPGGEDRRNHLSVRRAAAYLDRALSPEERASIEEHLADCEICRDEVVESARILEAVGGSGRSRRWAVGAATAAAAVLLGMFALETGLPGIGTPSRDQLRDAAPSSAEGVQRIEAIRPVPGGRTGPADLRFVWRAAGSDATYRLTVSRPDGEVVVAASTADTTFDAAHSDLERGERYFWYVDALSRDGRTATTGVRSFVVAP